MRTTRVVLLVLLVFALCGCKSASREQQAAAIFTEGNRIWSESRTTTKEWTAEYVSAFGPQDRAKFPANRASLRSSADKIVKILDKETLLSTEAIKHYEKAIALISDEQKRRGMGLLVSSLRKTLEAYEFIKSQMRLVTDESIGDARTFEEKFLGLGAQFGRSHRDSQAQLDEGRRILGI